MNNPIKIKEMAVAEITAPRNDGTDGSKLYKVSFILSEPPNNLWSDLFIQAWNSPPEWSTMHRPGIASIVDDRIILNGTTVEEVEKYHQKTLRLAVDVANQKYAKIMEKQGQAQEKERKMREEHKKNVREVSKRIKFD